MVKKSYFLFSILILTSLLLPACGDINQQTSLLSVTPTPTATVDPSGYQAVDPRACLVSEKNTLQSEQRRGQATYWLQGDLLAWRPGMISGKSELAYISPGIRSSWFTGALTITKGEDFVDNLSLASGVLVNGDLTWSPDGMWLAFIAYRPNEGLYTVMVSDGVGSQLIDLFPTDLARTDNRSSQKAIIGWRDNSTVQVIASCGEECRYAYDIDVTSPAAPVLAPTTVSDYTLLRKNLSISQRALTITPDAYPKNMVSGKWSPNEKLVAYLDRRGILWMLSIEEKVNYILEIGLRDVYEIQWAETNDYLAVRAEDKIFIFEIPCKN